MHAIRLTIFTTLALGLFSSSGFAQGKLLEKKRESKDATIKGRIVQHENIKFRLDLTELGCMLNQQIKLPDPKVPEKEWPKMTQKQREEWVKKFEASEEGKRFIANRKKLIESAENIEIQVEENGSFVVYDVPRGEYGLRGRAEKKIDGKDYVFEVFGKFSVKDVEEVLLDPMTVIVTRLTKPNEDIPNINIKTFDGKATISNKLMDNRNVLVSFWSLKSPPSVEFSKVVQKAFKDIQRLRQAKEENEEVFQLLSVCVDCDRKAALKHVVKNGLAGWHGYAENWEHETVSEFGVRSIPALFLLGADGKIKMTPLDFRFAANSKDVTLTQIINDVLDGKNIPTPLQTVNEPKTDNKN